ncbi:fumarylacetoacetate hydrolase family protein [Dethiosulfovibrio salsuginis]|uniref:2-keto-4-pentenoate hydratase/2-oxohepta-3-ene-1,7-dioic acid hydratase (Catechol pathway) n=1 Tax=Dethiosulfovibrio salsuginis TaxID=561720 RepID=A0A1X7KQ75_9BACT|nr:fumarylacetoacetate hydrolase family protein [Dethiosulfovibrio salsuginis]SMG43379.1 2-keto-4-pentenoate hydratase/2-oxohepta-3-ene-1,7-dioic acid hydratase (catechol pathway) [Dethiosulfovibrio salsuginis]
MRFVAFNKEGVSGVGVLLQDDRVLDVRSVLKDVSSIKALIERASDDDIALLASATSRVEDYRTYGLSEVVICPPIKRPIHDILCVGVNYLDHLKETKDTVKGFKEATAPVYFSKRAISILGSEDTIELRDDLDDKLDYEVELAVIIGKRGKDIPIEEVEDYIFGYSVFNDISSRSLQKRHGQWFRGKSLDTYTAMGPAILHKSALPFPVKIDVRSYVNDELRQSSNTEMMIADIPSLISELSMGMTLEPGDIVATGTPAGVGMGFSPPKYLKKGDKVVCEIPSIGKLVNYIN